MNRTQQLIKDFADTLHRLGFVVYLAKSGTYGFYTDGTGSRAVSFQEKFGRITLHGNYKASRESGTGWEIADAPSPLTEETARAMLMANAPSWTNNPRPTYCTAADQLKRYDASRYALYQPYNDSLKTSPAKRTLGPWKLKDNKTVKR